MSDLTRLPGPLAERWEWQQFAACAGLGTAKFFHPDGERGQSRATRERLAKGVCAGCPVRVQCAEHALRVREPYGVWGGMSEGEREEILARQADPHASPAQAS